MQSVTDGYAHYIKELRQYLNLSLTAFGDPLGYSATHIRQFENGTTDPSDAVINNICEVYGVEQGYFTGKVELKDAVTTVSITKDEKKGSSGRD